MLAGALVALQVEEVKLGSVSATPRSSSPHHRMHAAHSPRQLHHKPPFPSSEKGSFLRSDDGNEPSEAQIPVIRKSISRSAFVLGLSLLDCWSTAWSGQ